VGVVVDTTSEEGLRHHLVDVLEVQVTVGIPTWWVLPTRQVIPDVLVTVMSVEIMVITSAVLRVVEEVRGKKEALVQVQPFLQMEETVYQIVLQELPLIMPVEVVEA